MDLRIAHRFFGLKMFSITQSRGFTAQLLAQPLTENTGYFLLARRMLKLDADSPIMGGEIIRTPAGKLYLTEAHSTSEFQETSFYKTLRAYEVTDHVDVKAPTVTKDPILGRNIDASVGSWPVWKTIYCVIEPTVLEHDAFKNITPVYRIMTNENVPLGAIVDGKYKVNNVEYRGGCYFIEAQKL